MESIIETKAITILQFIQGLRGDLHVTLEEGTWAAWLYDLLKPHVTELVVCDPRKNALILMKQGNKSDKIDARKLADLLRGGYLCSVYHGENGLRTVKELARSYLTISKDLSRVMNRVKALYRSWGILCGGQQVYAPRHRSEWLNKIGEAGARRRAEFFYQQLDALRALRQAVRRDLLAESRKHNATKLLRQIPYIGPIRAALLIALIQTPYRFRTKRQLWTYSGLAIDMRDSAQHRYVAGQLQRSKKPQQRLPFSSKTSVCSRGTTEIQLRKRPGLMPVLTAATRRPAYSAEHAIRKQRLQINTAKPPLSPFNSRIVG
jgi:transposase